MEDLPKGSVIPSVSTPEGEQEIVQRVFDAVTRKIDDSMADALAAAVEEFKDSIREVVDSVTEKYQSEAKAKLDEIAGEATRRMEYAAGQIKLAMKDSSDLGRRISDLRDRLFNIASAAETDTRIRVEKAAAEVGATAEKYKRHVEMAGEMMTRVGSQICQFQEEMKPLRQFMEDCVKNGISPSSLGALVVRVQQLGANSNRNGRKR